jgi:hypothetical protein
MDPPPRNFENILLRYNLLYYILKLKSAQGPSIAQKRALPSAASASDRSGRRRSPAEPPRVCPFLPGGSIPYSPHGEETRLPEKARQNSQIQGP